MKRYFTVKEANQRLPIIEPLILSLQKIKEEISVKNRNLQSEKATLGRVASDDAFFAEEAELEFLVMQANGLIQSIREHGAEIKDIDLGLIDFYTMINGQEALLCWKLGEPLEIKFWHGIHEGYLGRKPILPFEGDIGGILF